MNTLRVRVGLSLVVVLIIGCAIDSIQAADIASVDAIDAAKIAILDIADQIITPETQALQIIEIADTQIEIDSMGPIDSRIEIATIDIAEEIQIIGRSDIGKTAQVIRPDIARLDLIARGVINDRQVIEI